MSERLSSFVPSIPMLGDEGPGFRNAFRPVIRGRHGVVSAGHYLAAAGGFTILARGGNAFDAGVAAGLCLNVVQPQSTNLGGVAPIIGYRSDIKEAFTLCGLGRWPRGTDPDALRQQYPSGLRWGVGVTIVPAAVMAWLTCLADHGRLSFSDVAQPAAALAEDGFPVYEFYRAQLAEMQGPLEQDEAVRSVLCPSGKIPDVGQVIRQPALARLLRELMEEERRLSHLGREAAIRGVIRYFYEGPVGARIAAWIASRGGILSAKDLQDFSMPHEPPVAVGLRGGTLFTCGPWCQGPVLAEALAILREAGIEECSHNSAQYLHLVIEALKLAFADREAFYGDPEFVEVPTSTLVSAAYARQRAQAISREKAWPEMPPPGEIARGVAWGERTAYGPTDPVGRVQADTSYVAAADAEGNLFSATPSDSALHGFLPELGISVSQRGIQSRLDPTSPNVVAPWKRPRLTPAPALLLHTTGGGIAFGTPGGDAQPQAMLQFLLNTVLHRQNLQAAVEQPRVLTFSFPNSFPPYDYYPGRVLADERIGDKVIQQLRAMGHAVDVMRAWSGDTSVCAAASAPPIGVEGAADARRDGYALAW